MIVLDTHVWLRWLHDPSQLSAPAKKEIRRAERKSSILVSAISVWEVAVKNKLGKLTLPLDINRWYAMARQYPAVTVEPLDPVTAIESTLLPGKFHQDPADRIIVALARRHGVALVTADKKILRYKHVQTVRG